MLEGVFFGHPRTTCEGVQIVLKSILLGVGATGLLFVTGCTTTEKVAVQQPGDMKLTCEEITEEFASLDAIMEEANENKGVNTANVAAAVFFWPAAVGNYMNASDAEKLVGKRRDHLMTIYTDKGC